MPSQSRLVFLFEWLLGGPCMSCGNRHESICPQARVELPPLNWHLTVFGCLKARLPRPMRRRRCRRSPLFVRADEAIEIVERVIAGYGTTRISRSGARVRQLFDEADRVRVVVSLDILHVLFQLGEAIADLAAIEI